MTTDESSLFDENVVLGNYCNNILQVLIAMAIRLPIGIVAPVLANAPSEEVTVTLMPIAM